MSEVKPDTPKLCPEPGCGLEMITGGWDDGVYIEFDPPYVCPRNADAHALCKRVAELEALLKEKEDSGGI